MEVHELRTEILVKYSFLKRSDSTGSIVLCLSHFQKPCPVSKTYVKRNMTGLSLSCCCKHLANCVSQGVVLYVLLYISVYKFSQTMDELGV